MEVTRHLQSNWWAWKGHLAVIQLENSTGVVKGDSLVPVTGDGQCNPGERRSCAHSHLCALNLWLGLGPFFGFTGKPCSRMPELIMICGKGSSHPSLLLAQGHLELLQTQEREAVLEIRSSDYHSLNQHSLCCLLSVCKHTSPIAFTRILSNPLTYLSSDLLYKYLKIETQIPLS